MKNFDSTLTLKNRPELRFSEIESHADFSRIRYAQCWEDADILLKALGVKAGDVCLSVASAGDNSLSLLSANPAKVIAVDFNRQQIACLELKARAIKFLSYEELLCLVGIRAGDRLSLYAKLRPHLSEKTRNFFDVQKLDLSRGIGHAGKFEKYFEIFRNAALPFVHSKETCDALLVKRDSEERRRFFDEQWNTPKWRTLFRMFFSRKVMGLLGRDPAFFQYVQTDVAQAILDRTEYALTALDPSENPYMQWILKGTYVSALPHYLRRENYEKIKANIDKLELHVGSIESVLEDLPPGTVDKFNLSDIFEYMSMDNYHKLLSSLVLAGRTGGRLVYWNMLAPRSRPEKMAPVLTPHNELAEQLHKEDKAFFYSKLVIEEITC
jgi:S-adenosylmethionine-diacylglycerol 3-amino-3-carboxypropyl transferase